jgi:uncharacterized protein (TIGR03437 family)
MSGCRFLYFSVVCVAPMAAQAFVSPGPHPSSHAAPFDRLPAAFEFNAGQFDPKVRFFCRTSGFDLYLTRGGAMIFLEGASVMLGLAGSKELGEPAGIDRLPGVINYLTGNDPTRWKAGIPRYKRVRYQSVYPGISVEYYGQGRTLEFDFSIDSGADPSVIRMTYDGADSVQRTREGDLAVSVAGTVMLQRKPVAWQEIGGRRVPVRAEYRVNTRLHEASFQLAEYDRSHALIIDPVLHYGTYFGGAGAEGANSLAVDIAGNTYITGRTTSTNLPTSPTAPFQSGLRGPADAFVAKFNAAGTALIYTTYLGGSGDDAGSAIAVDAAGNAYVAGLTSSANFPAAGGGVAQYYGGAHDAFVAVLNPAGNALVYSGYLGGAGDDIGNALALDSSANIYVAGYTNSASITGVTGGTPPPAQRTNGGGYDAFAIKLSKTGTILYSTFFGGTGDEIANGIAVDGSGSAYIAGSTTSPTLPGASSGRRGAKRDAFVAVLSSNGTSFFGVTDIGGTSDQAAFGIAVDKSNTWFLTGLTNSVDFPLTKPVQSQKFGGYDAFLVAVGMYGPIFSTYLGGQGTDVGYGIAVDSNGDVYVAGYTDSSDLLPGLPNQPRSGPNTFVARITGLPPFYPMASGPTPAFVFAAYLGAVDPNDPVSVALSGNNEPFVAGYASAGAFPAGTPAPAFNFAGGASDAFVAKLGSADLSFASFNVGPYNPGSSTPGNTSGASSTPPQVIPGTDLLIALNLINSGPETAINVAVRVQLPTGVSFLRCPPPTACSVSGSVVSAVFPSLAVGALSPQLLILAKTALTLNGPVSIDASVFSALNDVNLANNTASAGANVQGVATFAVSTLALVFGPSPIGKPATQILSITPTAGKVSVSLTLTPGGTTPAGTFSPDSSALNAYQLATKQDVSFVFTPAAPVPYTAYLDIANSNGSETIEVVLSGSGSGPAVTQVVDSAGFGVTIADNAWVTLLGANFTDPNLPARTWASSDFKTGGQLPISLDGVSVRINRQQAFVEYISPTQINVLAPPDPNKTTGNVTVDLTTPTGTTSFTVVKDTIAPGLFSYLCNIPGFCNDAAHPGYYAAATLGPATVGHPANPLGRGQFISLYLSGLGDTTPEYNNSSLVSQLVNLPVKPTVTIGGVQAVVQYAGMVQGAAGLYQLNVSVPQNVPSGDQPVVVTLSGHSTPASGQRGPVFLNIAP